MSAGEVKDEHVKVISEWLREKHPNEKIMTELLIRRFIFCCHHDVQLVKDTIDLYYQLRKNAPEIFANRDPLSPEIQQLLKIADLVPLPNPTKENYKVFLYRLREDDYSNFCFNSGVKAFFMISDIRLATDPHLTDGEVPIFDMEGVSLKYLTKVVFSTLRKYMVYTQGAHPVRLKQIHVINTSSILDKIFSLVKPMMRSEVISMCHFHTPGSDTLYKYVPKEILPYEYGGEAGSLQELKKYWIDRLSNEREFFLDEVQRRNEKKIAPFIKNEPPQESFRTLCID